MQVPPGIHLNQKKDFIDRAIILKQIKEKTHFKFLADLSVQWENKKTIRNSFEDS